MNQPKYKKILHNLSVFVLFLLLAFLKSANASDNNTVYFYNSETNINNFASLKMEFDTYLSPFGKYRFQPFSDQKIFEKSISVKGDGIILLSSWHYRSLNGRLSLKPKLVGIVNGKSTQKRVLSAKKNIKNLDYLKGKKVASAGNKEYTRNLLKQMFGKENENILKSIKIQSVPKDIDALLAVGFGMAEAALTTENSLMTFEKINHKQFLLLNQLGKSEEMYLAIVAVMGEDSEGKKSLLDLLVKMNSAPDGEGKLRMLGLDRLRELKEQEIESLKQ